MGLNVKRQGLEYNFGKSQGAFCKKIWAKTISTIKDNKNEWYDIPKGITAAAIDPISGEINSNGFVCYYEKGSEPNYVDLYNIKDS